MRRALAALLLLLAALLPSAARAACSQPVPGPRATSIAIPAATLAQYSVLRQAQSHAEDAIAATVASVVGGDLARYDPHSVRLLRTLSGTGSIYLVLGYLSQSRCGPVAAERTELAQLPGHRHDTATAPIYCFVELAHTGNGYSCDLLAAVAAGHSFGTFVGAGNHPLEGGLVPDGVAAVTIEYRVAPSVTAPVSRNLFAGPQPPPPPEAWSKLLAIEARAAAQPGGATAAQKREEAHLSETIAEDLAPGFVSWLGPGGKTLQTFFPGVPTLLAAGGVVNGFGF
jgi:hypothetical protein